MIWALLIAGILVGLFLSGFFSGSETGLYRVNRIRLELSVQRRDPQAIRLARVLGDPEGALTVTLIGTNLMNYLTTALVAYMFGHLLGLGEMDTQIYTVLLLTPVVFVFGEVVPKNLFQLYADILLARGSRLLALSNRMVRITGAVWALKRLVRVITRMLSDGSTTDVPLAPKRHMAALLQEALSGHALGEAHSDLVDRVFLLSETPVHQVMVPRNRVVGIAADADRKMLVRSAQKTSHTHLPVLDPRRAHVMGVIKVDDLLRSDDWRTVGERAGPATTLRPHESLAGAITHLRRERHELAIVTERGGRMLGIVTLTDLLREVVGHLAVGE